MEDNELSENSEDTTLTADRKRNIKTYLQDKYDRNELQELLCVASFLDPRFKTYYIPKTNPLDDSSDDFTENLVALTRERE